MRFLFGKKGLSMVEYILGGALALAVVGAAVYAVAQATSGQGANTETSINAMPPQPSW